MLNPALSPEHALLLAFPPTGRLPSTLSAADCWSALFEVSSVSGRRRRARLLSRWPPSAAQTGRAVFPHPAFTKTFSLERQRRRTSRQGRRTRTCSTAAHPPAGGTSEPSLPPVASSHSTSILDRGCPGLSLKELSTSTTLLISSPVPLRPSSPTAFPGTLCRHSLVARLSPHLWCRVGGGALDCSRAGLRPPLKPCMQFSRTRLSRRRSSLSGDRRDHLNLCR